MKLKAFTKTKGRTGRPFLSFSAAGLFTISSGMIEKMQLKSTDKLMFFQDEDSSKDWYVTIDNENGQNIRTKDIKTFYMNNSNLRKELISSLKIEGQTGCFIIGAPTEVDGVNYWPLLFNKR